MYFHLLLFCLCFHSIVCVRFQQREAPHTAYGRQLNHAVQSSTLSELKDKPASIGHLDQLGCRLKTASRDDRKASLRARAGPSTPGTAVVDKTFDKKVKKLLTKWEKSGNSKTLNTLFNKILTLPYVQVTRVLWSMPYSLETDLAVQQLAIFESLLKIRQLNSIDKSEIIISSPRMRDFDKGLYERRGYKVLKPQDVSGDRTENWVTPTTFVFSSEEYIENIAGLIGHEGIKPSIYLGLSPRYLIQDTLKRPEYVPEKHCPPFYILTASRNYKKNNGCPEHAQKLLRDGFFVPFSRGRPYQDLVYDAEYKGIRPHTAVFWNPEHATGVQTGQVGDARTGASDVGQAILMIPKAPLQSPDTGGTSSAGPSVPLAPQAQSPDKAGTSIASPSDPLVHEAQLPDISSLSIDQASPGRKIRKVKRPPQGDDNPGL